MTEEHAVTVLWSKRNQRFVGACKCGFTVIGANKDEPIIRQNLQLHLSKHKQHEETKSAG